MKTIKQLNLVIFCILAWNISSAQSEYVDTTNLIFRSDEVAFYYSDRPYAFNSSRTMKAAYFDFNADNTVSLKDSVVLSSGYQSGSKYGHSMASGNFYGDSAPELMYTYQKANNLIETDDAYIEVDGQNQELMSLNSPTQTAGDYSSDRVESVGANVDGVGYDEFVLAYRYSSGFRIAANGTSYFLDDVDNGALAAADFNNDGTDEVVFVGERNVSGGTRDIFLIVFSDNFTDVSPELALFSISVSVRLVAKTGDINGDGKEEIIFGASTEYTNSSDDDAFLGVVEISTDLNSFTYDATKNLSENRADDFDSNGPAIAMDVADLNFDGRSDIVFGAGSDPQVGIYEVANDFSLTLESNVLSFGWQYPLESKDWLVAGDFNPNDDEGGIFICESSQNGSGSGGDVISTYYLKMYSVSANLQISQENTIEINDTTLNSGENYFQLVRFDGDNDKVKVGAGRHFQVVDYSQPLAVLMTPPIHFDIINGDTIDVNDCYNGGDCDFKFSYTSGTSMSDYISGEVKGTYAVSKAFSAEGQFAGMGLQTRIENSSGNSLSTLTAQKDNFSFSQTTTAFRGRDLVYVIETTYDVWEYPIFVDGVMEGHFVTVEPNPITEEVFIPLGRDVDHFFNHEPGNILSYPDWLNPADSNTVAVEDVYPGAQLSLAPSNAHSLTWEWGNELDSSVVGTHSISMNLQRKANFNPTISPGIISVGGGVSFEFASSYNQDNISTHTSTITNSITIEINLDELTNDLASSTQYKIYPYVYYDETGIMYLDYSTQLHPNDVQNSLWYYNNYGGFAGYSKQDPAFIMPAKLNDERGQSAIHPLEKDRTTSIQMHPREPEPGDTVRISAWVYNFALGPDPSDDIELMFYAENESGSCAFPIKDLNGVGLFTIPPIEPRKHRTMNFQWIYPDSLGDLPRIYGVIDPENKIADEIHERNNRAFFSVDRYTTNDTTLVPNDYSLPAVVHVDQSVVGGNQSGDSWTNAVSELAAVLASPGIRMVDTIKVAAGNYLPDAGNPCRSSQDGFFVDKNLVLLGGYPSGGGTRDWQTNQTILDGDVGLVGDSLDNVLHVLHCDKLDSTSTIDGFVLQHASGSTGDWQTGAGGGLLLTNCTNTLFQNLVIRNNAKKWGGAVYNYYSDVTFDQVVFVGNRVERFGGAIYNFNSSPSISNCLFYKNWATMGGGAIRNWSNSDVPVSYTTFYQNGTDTKGGALYASNTATFALTNCILFDQEVGDVAEAATVDAYHAGSSDVVYDHCMTEVDNNGTMLTIGEYPGFVDTTQVQGADGLWATTDDGLRLRYGSLAVNKAVDMATTTSHDLIGKERIVGSAADYGAYEFDYVFPCGQYAELTIEDDPILSSIYRASGLIISQGTVTGSSDGPVQFQSQSQIDLLGGFEVQSGEIFEAKVENPCQD